MRTEQKVIALLEELSGVEGIYPAQDLALHLAMDSLAMVSMLINIEDAFQIELDESDMDPFFLITVQDVINLVARYVRDEEKEE